MRPHWNFYNKQHYLGYIYIFIYMAVQRSRINGAGITTLSSAPFSSYITLGSCSLFADMDRISLTISHLVSYDELDIIKDEGHWEGL